MSAEGSERWVRVTLGLGVLIGLLGAAYFAVPGLRPASFQQPLARDFRIYHATAQAFLAGEPFVGYSASFGGRTLSYVYPPVTILAFVPYGLLPWEVAFGIHALLTGGAMLGVGLLAVWTIERERGELPLADRLLVASFPVLSALSLVAIGLGQIDPLIALALAGTFVASETGRDRLAGLGVALGGVFKFVPALAGGWLVYRRSWRAVGAAVAVSGGALVLSLLLFGVDAHVAFVQHVLTERSRLQAVDNRGGGVAFSVTLAQPLSVLLPDVQPFLYPVFALGLLVPGVLACYRYAERLEDRLVAFLVTLTAFTLVSPASNFTWVVYLLFPAVALGYLLDTGPSRAAMLAGLAFLSLPFQRWQPRTISGIFGYREAYETTLAPAFEALLTVGTMPLYGTLILFLGCGVYAWQRQDEPAVATEPDPDALSDAED